MQKPANFIFLIALSTLSVFSGASAQSALSVSAKSSLGVSAQSTPSFTVQIQGSGTQPLVLLPGFACSGEVWKETVARYGSRYKCYVLTMAGFAGATPQAEPDLHTWVKDIAAYIQQNHLNKPVIIGHSMGGGMAMILAATYPTLVGKIIVVDALPCLNALMNPAFTAAEHPDCASIIGQMTQMTDDQFAGMQKMTMPRLMADTVHLAQVIQWSKSSDRKTFGSMYCQYSNEDMRATIAAITCPALILMESPFGNYKPAIEAQFKKLTTANIQYAGHGLHFIMYDDKDWYFQQTDSFLQ